MGKEVISENIPLVSICCTVYNHEKFLQDALNSFLKQQINFSIEILINDDCSTDGSAEIIRKYQQNFPDIIKPVFQEENQYSKGIMPIIELLIPRSKGKYVAICEGDDYWTDPQKLQKQVDFLETHPDYNLCCGAFNTLEVKTGVVNIEIEKRLLKNNVGFSFTLNEMSISWFTKTLTSVFRFDAFHSIQNELGKYTISRDVHLFYHLVKESKGYYFGEILGVYRIHKGGIKSLVGDRVNKNGAYHRTKELYEKNRDYYTRSLYFRSVLSLLKFNLQNKYDGNDMRTKVKLFFKMLQLALSPGLIRYLTRAYLKTI